MKETQWSSCLACFYSIARETSWSAATRRGWRVTRSPTDRKQQQQLHEATG